jgi:hypothetical protein
MAMRDLIPWSRGRDVAPARGDDPGCVKTPAPIMIPLS